MRVDTINRSRARAIDTFVSIESGDRYTPTGDASSDAGVYSLAPDPLHGTNPYSLLPNP